jgi:Uma2 family endonuclease
VTAATTLEHPLGPHTVEEWLATDDPEDGSSLELIWGYWYVSPAPSYRHQRAAHRLGRVIEDALMAAGRTDLHMFSATAVEISTPWRTGLIPDVVVVDIDPDGVSVAREHLVLAAEVWSPGNSRSERETKIGAYAEADVPYFWSIELDHDRRVSALVAYRLIRGRYVEQTVATPGSTVTITAAPIAITFDPAYLTA